MFGLTQETKEKIYQSYKELGSIEATQEMYFCYPVPEIIREMEAQETEEEAEQSAEETEAPQLTNPDAKQYAGRRITLKIYADNGKAVYEYEFVSKGEVEKQCKGEIKDRDFAIAIAKRTAQRCNEHQAHLYFEHGRPVENGRRALEEPWGDLCLSAEALEAVERELRQAAYQTRVGGGYSNWR